VVADHDGNATANKKLKLPENEFRTELRRAAVLGSFTGWMTPRRSAVEVRFRKGQPCSRRISATNSRSLLRNVRRQ
jgi:hypothetical protein